MSESNNTNWLTRVYTNTRKCSTTQEKRQHTENNKTNLTGSFRVKHYVTLKVICMRFTNKIRKNVNLPEINSYKAYNFTYKMTIKIFIHRIW